MEGMASAVQEAASPGLWALWLIALNSVSVFFALRHREAGFVLAAWLASLALLAAVHGLEPALVHLAVWPPLLVWLVWRNPVDNVRAPYGAWLVALFASNLVALGLSAFGLYQDAAARGDLSAIAAL
jgi:hypothetical protein